jgi:hypothetical protein
MENSTHNQLLAEISAGKKGKLIFPADFKYMATSDTIRKILSRLQKEGILTRVAHGIYLYPKTDPVLGIIHPSTDDIAQAVAKRDKVRIMPASMTALNRLGLSTQVPMKAVYLTDGNPKTIKAGKRTITFKSTTPKKLSLKGKLSSLVIQALEELGRDGITPEVLKKVTDVLQKENTQILKEDAKLAPAWVSELLSSIMAEMNDYA